MTVIQFGQFERSIVDSARTRIRRHIGDRRLHVARVGTHQFFLGDNIIQELTGMDRSQFQVNSAYYSSRNGQHSRLHTVVRSAVRRLCERDNSFDGIIVSRHLLDCDYADIEETYPYPFYLDHESACHVARERVSTMLQQMHQLRPEAVAYVVELDGSLAIEPFHILARELTAVTV